MLGSIDFGLNIPNFNKLETISLKNIYHALQQVPTLFYDIVIIGEETIVYCSASAFKAIPITPAIAIRHLRHLRVLLLLLNDL